MHRLLVTAIRIVLALAAAAAAVFVVLTLASGSTCNVSPRPYAGAVITVPGAVLVISALSAAVLGLDWAWAASTRATRRRRLGASFVLAAIAETIVFYLLQGTPCG